MARIENDRGSLFNILSGLSDIVRGGAAGAGAAQKHFGEQEQMSGLRDLLSSKGYSPKDLAPFSPQQLQSILLNEIKEGPKRDAKQQEDSQGALRALTKLDEAEQFFGQTIGYEGVTPKSWSSAEYVRAKDILKSLQNDPYIRKSGGVTPSIDLGSKLPEQIMATKKKLAEYYNLGPKQSDQTQEDGVEPKQQDGQLQQEPGQDRQLPEQLVQPRSVQQMLQGGPQSDQNVSPAARAAGSGLFSYLTSGAPIPYAPAIPYVGPAGAAVAGITGAGDIAEAFQPHAEAASKASLPSDKQIDELADRMNLSPEQKENMKNAYGEMRSDKEITSALNSVMPSKNNIRKLVTAAIGKDYVTPKNNLDKNISYLAEKLGARRMFSDPGIVRSIVGLGLGEGGRQAAKAMDLGPTAEMVFDIGMSSLADPIFDKVRDGIAKVSGGVINKFDSKLPGKFTDMSKVHNKVTSSIEELSASTDAKTQSLVKQLKRLENQINPKAKIPKVPKAPKVKVTPPANLSPQDELRRAKHFLKTGKFPEEVIKKARSISPAKLSPAELKKFDMGKLRQEIRGMNQWWYNEGKDISTRKMKEKFFDVKIAAENALKEGSIKNRLGGEYKKFATAKQAYAGLSQAESALENIQKEFSKGNFHTRTSRILTQSYGGRVGHVIGRIFGGYRGGTAGAVVGATADEVSSFLKIMKLPYFTSEFMKLVPEAVKNNSAGMKPHLENIIQGYAKEMNKDQRKTK